MNTDWLGYFVILCETKSFRAASDKIGITSPALSKAIFELENYFKVTLIKRKNKFDGLTPAGEFLYRTAREILSNLNSLENQVKDFVAGEPQGNISIASEALSQNYVLPQIIASVVEKYPKIYPKMHMMLSDVAEKNILEGKIDLAVLSRKPAFEEIKYLKLTDIPHYIIGLPQSKKHWTELNFIIPRFFWIKDEIFADGWNDNKYKRRSVAEVEGLETTIKFIENGLGVAYLPEACVGEQLVKGTLDIVAEAPFEYHDELFLIWSKAGSQSLAYFKVIEMIKESFHSKGIS